MGIVRANAPLRGGEIQRFLSVGIRNLITPAGSAFANDNTQIAGTLSEETIAPGCSSSNGFILNGDITTADLTDVTTTTFAAFIFIFKFTCGESAVKIDGKRHIPGAGIERNQDKVAGLNNNIFRSNQGVLITIVGIAVFHSAIGLRHIDLISPIRALSRVNCNLQLAIFSGSKAVKICIITIQINRAFAHNQIIRIAFSAYCGSSQRNIELLILKKAIANQRQLVNLTSIQLQAVCTVDFGIVPVHTVIDIPVIVGSCTIYGQQNIICLSMDNQGNLIFGIQVNHLIKADSQIIAVGYCESCHRQHCQNHCQHNQNAN